MIFSPNEIQETVNMFMRQKLDIRCITMGISLLDCADSDSKRACDKIYDKIMKKAGKLVQTGQDIEKEFGVPIINKRISTAKHLLLTTNKTVCEIAFLCGFTDPLYFTRIFSKEIGIAPSVFRQRFELSK